MKRKIFAALMAGVLTMSLTVTAFAGSSSTLSPTAKEAAKETKSSSSSDDDDDHMSDEQKAQFEAARNAGSSSSAASTTAATTPAAAPAAAVATRSYAAQVTPAVAAAVATTPAQSVALSAAAQVAPIDLGGAALGSIPADPGLVSLAKLDAVFNPAVTRALARAGIGTNGTLPMISGAGSLVATDGRAIRSQRINIAVPGITSAANVRIIVYQPDANGVMQPRVVTPRMVNGQLQASLPVPCEYNIVTNAVLPQ